MVSEKPQFPKFWMWLLIGAISFQVVWIVAAVLMGFAAKHVQGGTDNLGVYITGVVLIIGAIPFTICALSWPFVLFGFGYRFLEWRRGRYFFESYGAQVNRPAEGVLKRGSAGVAE